jgi:hypothetical protein
MPHCNIQCCRREGKRLRDGYDVQAILPQESVRPTGAS